MTEKWDRIDEIFTIADVQKVAEMEMLIMSMMAFGETLKDMIKNCENTFSQEDLDKMFPDNNK